MPHLLITFCALSLLFACSTTPHDQNVDLKATVSTDEATTVADEIRDDWRRELIVLPPQFAPSMPQGIEELRFAPGMFQAQAPDFWSYAFVLWLDAPLSKTDLHPLLEAYYDGLIAAVAKDKGLDIKGEPAKVSVVDLGDGRFRAFVELIDAFVTQKPLQIRMEISTAQRAGGSVVSAAVSPQSRYEPIWLRLREQLAALRKSRPIAPSKPEVPEGE